MLRRCLAFHRPNGLRGTGRRGFAAAREAKEGPRFLGACMRLAGTTTGAALFAVTSSVLAWPLADVWLGPWLIKLGLGPNRVERRQLPEVAMEAALRKEIVKGGEVAAARVVIGDRATGKVLEQAAAEAGRPVLYLPLGEATCPHHLFIAVQAGAYSADRLGLLGTFTNSMCVWWLVLFDIVVGREFYSSRAFHLSAVLAHLRRALLCKLGMGGDRPLVVLDHLDDLAAAVAAMPAHDPDGKAMRAMLRHLFAWCATVVYDDATADVVLCGGPGLRLWGESALTGLETAPQFSARMRPLLR